MEAELNKLIENTKVNKYMKSKHAHDHNFFLGKVASEGVIRGMPAVTSE